MVRVVFPSKRSSPAVRPELPAHRHEHRGLFNLQTFISLSDFPYPRITGLVTGPSSLSSPLKSSPGVFQPVHRKAGGWQQTETTSPFSLSSLLISLQPSLYRDRHIQPACHAAGVPSAGNRSSKSDTTRHMPQPDSSPDRQPVSPERYLTIVCGTHAIAKTLVHQK